MGTNAALDSRRASAKTALENVAESIATQPHITMEDVLVALATDQLDPDKNSGQQRFYAVVTKVLGKSEHLTDMFLSKWYEAERLNGITDAEAASSKVAFLHVPSLHTYLTTFDTFNSQQEYKELTSTDLSKIPAITTKPVKIGDLVQVTFENLKDYSGARILEIDDDKSKTLYNDTIKFVSSREVMKKIAACKLLSLDKAEGYAITTRTLLNSKNPIYGYDGLYKQLVERGGLLDSDRLIRKVVAATPNSELLSKDYYPSGFAGSATSAEAINYFKTNSSAITFEFKLHASDPIRKFLSEVLPVENNANYTPAVKEWTSTGLEDQRSLFLEMVLVNSEPTTKLNLQKIKDNLKEDIAKYLQSVITKSFNWGWSQLDGKPDFYRLDIFGTTADLALKNHPVEKAIEYSHKKINASTATISSGQPISNQPMLSGSATTPAQSAEAQKPQKTAKIKSEIPNCEDQALINNEIYINVEKSKTSRAADNAHLAVIAVRYNMALKGLANVEALVDWDLTAHPLPNSTKSFNYKATNEIIAAKPEGQAPKQPAKDKKKPKNKKKKGLKRGTNITKMHKNGKMLAEFVKQLRQIIAANENIEQKRVLVFPISVFRKFRKNKRGAGQDANSRHFFNRAIDFTVYINTAEDFKDYAKGIPMKGTYEIPNTIIYLYVLKLLELQKVPFGICGLGLLRRGRPRKTGYVHYEYMGGLDDEGKEYVKVNRRWVSKPSDKKDTSVYGRAFGRKDENKDAIIKAHVAKEVQAKLGILPTKLENLL